MPFLSKFTAKERFSAFRRLVIQEQREPGSQRHSCGADHETRVDLDAQRFPIELVDAVECPETPSRQERVDYEIAAPVLIGSHERCNGRLIRAGNRFLPRLAD